MYGKFKYFQSIATMVQFLNEGCHVCGQGTVKAFEQKDENILVIPKGVAYEASVKNLLTSGYQLDKEARAYCITPEQAGPLFARYLEFKGTVYQIHKGYCYVQSLSECSDDDREIRLGELVEVALETDDEEEQRDALIEMAETLQLHALLAGI